MKEHLNNLVGYKLHATDGDIGEVREVYFEDDTWMVRYLIVETAGLFAPRKVLLSPEAVLNTDKMKKAVIVNLTREQIINSPETDTEITVDRQHEILLAKYYGWPNYWAGGLWNAGIGTTGMMIRNTLPFEDAIEAEKSLEEPSTDFNTHLRSSRKVKGYTITATDENIGEVADFIIDVINWRIDFLVIDTGNWLPGKKVLISPEWITDINWETSSVRVPLNADTIRESPQYIPDHPITESYAAGLHAYYENAARRLSASDS